MFARRCRRANASKYAPDVGSDVDAVGRWRENSGQEELEIVVVSAVPPPCRRLKSALNRSKLRFGMKSARCAKNESSYGHGTDCIDRDSGSVLGIEYCVYKRRNESPGAFAQLGHRIRIGPSHLYRQKLVRAQEAAKASFVFELAVNRRLVPSEDRVGPDSH